jgi:hypothetical protein
MPQSQKIATCCYCGTRAVMRFDDTRHELVCSACGAPLHDMKFMPQRPEKKTKKAPSKPYRPAAMPGVARAGLPEYDPPKRRSKKARKRRKPIFRRVIEELWDEIEDIFD